MTVHTFTPTFRFLTKSKDICRHKAKIIVNLKTEEMKIMQNLQTMDMTDKQIIESFP